MNKNERQAVLKMLIIREELTDKEFINAINFIQQELVGVQDTDSILKKEFSVKKKRLDNIPALLNEIKKEQPEKYDVLNGLYKYVQDATIFKTVIEARNFASEIGVKNISSKAKQEVIAIIFEALSDMSHEIILEKISNIKLHSEESDESYQRLSKFIMNKKTK